MALFKMDRDFKIAALGHSIQFRKGEETHVPSALHQEAMKFGAVPCDADAKLNMPKQFKKPVIPVDGDRMQAIIKACAYLQDKNAKDDFGANGLPKVGSIKSIVDFVVSGKERDEAWVTMKKAQAAEANPTNENQ
jgi:hypothetical protein